MRILNIFNIIRSGDGLLAQEFDFPCKFYAFVSTNGFFGIIQFAQLEILFTGFLHPLYIYLYRAKKTFDTLGDIPEICCLYLDYYLLLTA